MSSSRAQHEACALPVAPPLVGVHRTLADALTAAGTQHGEREAIVDGDRRLSFAEWDRCAEGLARVLVQRGVRPGDVVAIVLPSSIDYAIAYGAITKAGAIATGLNLRLGAHEVAAILAIAPPALVIVDRDAAAFRLPAGVATFEHSELPAAYTAAPLAEGRPPRQPDDPAVIIWTSGTTGVPKGAWFDHRNLESAVLSAGIMSRPYDRKLVGTPFPHAGYMAKLWDQLAWGTCIVVSPAPWTPQSMLHSLVHERITVAGGVPTQWAKLLELPDVGAADLSSVRLGLVATAPASPELIERVTATIGCPLIVRYAMTESPSITGTEPHDPPDVQCHTVGRAQEGMEIDLVDEAGAPVTAGAVGRVRVRGACVMRGYWGAPETTAAVLGPDGWLTSSDLGRLDPDGNLVLVGRTTDMYIRGGYNVYPLEVENVLADHPQIDRVAVVGTAAAVIGEIGVAFVAPTDPAHPPTLAALRQWTRERLADYKAPDRLVIVEALPLTSMLKIDKAQLSRMAALTTDTRTTDTRTTDTRTTDTRTGDGAHH
ncbi:MAG: AMP-binding protein [Actinomycetota bacterium]|nr:AMP-binding protein [Actinomycetota bacterium]